MMRMIPPTSSASEMGLFMILMAARQAQDTRNDLRPLWGVTHQEVQRLQESNLLWMAAMCGSEATPRAAGVGSPALDLHLPSRIPKLRSQPVSASSIPITARAFFATPNTGLSKSKRL